MEDKSNTPTILSSSRPLQLLNRFRPRGSLRGHPAWGRGVRATIAAAALAGCARYTPLELPRRPELAASLAALEPGVALPAGLGVADIGTLALRHDPDLVAAYAQLGVARAQLTQARVRPNPSLTGALLPLLAGQGNTTAWNAGFGYDVRSLLTHGATVRAARESLSQTEAQLLWQQWQVVNTARLLAVDLIQGNRGLQMIAAQRSLLRGRIQAANGAVAAGNATIAQAAPDIAAAQALAGQQDDGERQQLSRRQQLAALLGLSPSAALPLADQAILPPLDLGQMDTDLATVVERRPDLVALRHGYAAQDAKLRGAILAQFPALNIGVIGAQDNSGVQNLGPQITIDLPLFDRNQGNIAIERATRVQLQAEYSARLIATQGQIVGLRQALAQLDLQHRRARADLAANDATANQANSAFQAGNLDARSYVDLVSARLSAQLLLNALDQSALEARVALATLVGAGMPPLTLTPDPRLPGNGHH